MNDAPKAHLSCNSCQARGAMDIADYETTIEATARLRVKMGANCPRQEATRHLCPMRAEQRELSR